MTLNLKVKHYVTDYQIFRKKNAHENSRTILLNKSDLQEIMSQSKKFSEVLTFFKEILKTEIIAESYSSAALTTDFLECYEYVFRR